MKKTKQRKALKVRGDGVLQRYNENRYYIWNDTDKIIAAPGDYSKKEGLAWIRDFKDNLKRNQGYYLTFRRERIPVEKVIFKLLPVSG
jgi:hypothetical protein